MAIPTIHGHSTRICVSMNATHEYVLAGRSRASYSDRWATNIGWICWTKLAKIMKIEKNTICGKDGPSFS